MFINFLIRKTAGSGMKSVQQIEQLAGERHRLIIQKFKKRKVYPAYKDNI